MIGVIEQVAEVLLWIISASFAASGMLCLLAMTHHWKDREFTVIFSVVTFIFAIFSVAAAYAALAVGGFL